MGLDEAREVLGVAAGASADEVRRAYMRAVKRHRPEWELDVDQLLHVAADLENRGFLSLAQAHFELALEKQEF